MFSPDASPAILLLHSSGKCSDFTASGYLATLVAHGILTSQKVGKEKVYLNKKLFEIVKESGSAR
jgi:hypothetical protein